MEEEERSSFRALYEYLAAAGELNPFTILGISPVVGLTIEAVGDAYYRALRHLQNQGSSSLPPTRGPRVSTASQVIAAWASLSSTQADLDRSVRKWRNGTEQTWDPLAAPGTIDPYRLPPPRAPITPSRRQGCPCALYPTPTPIRRSTREPRRPSLQGTPSAPGSDPTSSGPSLPIDDPSLSGPSLPTDDPARLAPVVRQLMLPVLRQGILPRLPP